MTINNDGIKSIFINEGKKINGHYPKAVIYFGVTDDNDYIINVSFDEWVKNVNEDVSSLYVRGELLKAAINSIEQFNKKVEFNMYCRGKDLSFIEKVEKLKDYGVKIGKKGLKINYTV